MSVSEQTRKSLEKIGLTGYEIKAFTSLLKTGEITASELSQQCNVPYSKIYEVLGMLEEKGWIGSDESRPTKYFAKSPNSALQTTKQKAEDLKNFYLMLNKSKIFWAEQSEPRGFGDAVKYSESFVGNDDFLVIAGDTLIPKGDKVIKKLMNTKLKGKNDAILLLKKVPDPRRFGVAVINQTKNKIIITNVEEKPKNPKSNLSTGLDPSYVNSAPIGLSFS